MAEVAEIHFCHFICVQEWSGDNILFFSNVRTNFNNSGDTFKVAKDTNNK